MLKTRVTRTMLVFALLSGIAVAPVVAAPGQADSSPAVCSSFVPAQVLGVDGGMSALREGKSAASVAAAISYSAPSGVDGGLMGLLFAGSGEADAEQESSGACTTAFATEGD